ncbi:1-aminocyclopropane-1-carboxylate deaminase/D-cysteine desulfhydrase [Planosporangium flavigriseum]|uniref:1-aminocyclopropane-1-carboxylate deaminase/D-cysteine desulfhydrase n=1 Tax=Planosporangium flavigriseum TaxID=373681 RepID=UPI001EF34BB8|nr:pyridoxal-phosphate dependent enzyme [Planosporangium flavigriseum]
MPVHLRLPSPLVGVPDDRLDRRGVRLLLKRDDLIHPDLPGNKWRKLKYNLVRAAEQGHPRLLTFGGAYSNHIRATAAAGFHFGFDTIGVIRGEEHTPLNLTLEYAVSRGMRLTYLDRSTYRRKHTPEVVDRLRREFGEFYLLPEGGSNELAVRGCAEVPAELAEPYDVICVPVGTGGTLAGIAGGLPAHRRAIGFSVLKGGEFLAGEVEELQRRAFGSPSKNWHIEYGFHFGGYAKRTGELDAFVADWADRHGTPLDRIYVAKMMYGIVALAEAGAFEPGTTVVAVITA